MNILNYSGLIASVVVVVGAILIAEYLSKKEVITQESTRKLIHIGVSNWWFIFIFMIDNFWNKRIIEKNIKKISGIQYINNNVVNLITTVSITVIFYFIINLI